MNTFISIRYTFFILFLLAGTLPVLAQPTAQELEKQAHETYEEAYLKKTPREQADTFEEAADKFEKAAEAYRAEGNKDKAAEMEAWARAARSNAEIRQDNRGQASLPATGPGFKMVALPEPPTRNTFSVGAVGDLPLNRGISSNYFPRETFDRIRQAIYTDEAQFNLLLEKMGGEFFIGTFSEEPAFTQPVFRPGVAYGLTGSWRPRSRLGVQLSMQRSVASVTADFPVTVIRFTDGETHQERGVVQTDWRQLQVALGAQWLLTTGAVRPFLGAGAQWSRITGLETYATIGGQRLALSEMENSNRWGPYTTAGVEWQVVGGLSLDGRLVWVKWREEMPAGQQSVLSAQLVLRWDLF